MRTHTKTRASSDSALNRVAVAALLLAIAASGASGAGSPVRSEHDARISVTAAAGGVNVTMAGAATKVRESSTVLLPARVVTDRDGMLALTQAGTNITIASDTDVEIPAEAVDGNLIARLVQHRGNVFYDVAPRDVGKLRVETPLLVAVIKGTQFNVAVQEDSTTISLFEGRLEIRTPDGSDVVQLSAGEIAIRSRVEDSIRVVGMNDERVATPRGAEDAGGEVVDGALALDAVVPDSLAVVGGAEFDTRGAAAAAAAVSGDLKLSPTDLGLDLAGTSTDLGVAVGDAGANVTVEAGLDLGGGALDLGLDTGVDLGGAGTIDVGLDAGLTLADTGLDLGLDVGLDLGTIDLGLDAGVDLSGGGIEVDSGLDLGLGGLPGAGGAGATVPLPPVPRGGLLGGLL